MKKRNLRPEVVLYGIIAVAILIGAMLGATLTWTIMTYTKADATEVPLEERKHIPTHSNAASNTPRVEDNATTGPEPAETEEGIKVEVHRVGCCEITAYCSCVECCGIWSDEHPSRIGTGYVQKTATGTIPAEGRTVAVDPEVIPLGAAVWINGVSYIAEDTGSAVKGKVVDIYFDSHEEARLFGRQETEIYYIY